MFPYRDVLILFLFRGIQRENKVSVVFLLKKLAITLAGLLHWVPPKNSFLMVLTEIYKLFEVYS